MLLHGLSGTTESGAWRAIASKSESQWRSSSAFLMATVAMRQPGRRLIVVPERRQVRYSAAAVSWSEGSSKRKEAAEREKSTQVSLVLLVACSGQDL